jgi:flagellar biosynthetic protein FliP
VSVAGRSCWLPGRDGRAALGGRLFAQSLSLASGTTAPHQAHRQLIALTASCHWRPDLVMVVVHPDRRFLPAAPAAADAAQHGDGSLAMFLTAFVMAPTFQQAYQEGVAPLMAEQIDEQTAFTRSAAPFKLFMLSQVREKDLGLFMDMAGAEPAESPEEVSLQILIPAFMISELRRAFEIGYLLFVPFLIIDMVVASVLMSMGMMMLPPVMIALPFKLVFFVLVDGWYLVAGSLVRSFGGGHALTQPPPWRGALFTSPPRSRGREPSRGDLSLAPLMAQAGL